MVRTVFLAASLVLSVLSGGCGGNDDGAVRPPASDVTLPSPPTADRPFDGSSTDPTATATSPVTSPGTTALTSPATVEQRVEQLKVRVLERYPHDPSAFTQGLVFEGGELFESTGLEGASSVRRVELRSGAVTARRDLDPTIFGEGLAVVGQRLIMLSWKNGRAFQFDRDTLAPQGEFSYQGEGWGLCFDGESLVHSDGSNQLVRRDPETFAVRSAVPVLEEGRPVDRLNELECVGDSVYANVWLTSTIVRIDAASGRVTARIDAAALVPGGLGPDDVLNGIAHDERDGTFLLTGKRWGELYRVTFEP